MYISNIAVGCTFSVVIRKAIYSLEEEEKKLTKSYQTSGVTVFRVMTFDVLCIMLSWSRSVIKNRLKDVNIKPILNIK